MQHVFYTPFEQSLIDSAVRRYKSWFFRWGAQTLGWLAVPIFMVSLPRELVPDSYRRWLLTGSFALMVQSMFFVAMRVVGKLKREVDLLREQIASSDATID